MNESTQEPGYVHAPYQVREVQRLTPGGPVVKIQGDDGKMRDPTAEEEAIFAAAKAKRDDYREQHRCCPKCGGTHFVVTLVWFAGDDLNDARCQAIGCGWVGTVHDRVPETKP